MCGWRGQSWSIKMFCRTHDRAGCLVDAWQTFEAASQYQSSGHGLHLEGSYRRSQKSQAANLQHRRPLGKVGAKQHGLQKQILLASEWQSSPLYHICSRRQSLVEALNRKACQGWPNHLPKAQKSNTSLR